MSKSSTHVLVDEDNGNVFPLPRERLKRLFYLRVFGFLVYDEKVLLSIRRICNVLLHMVLISSIASLVRAKKRMKALWGLLRKTVR